MGLRAGLLRDTITFQAPVITRDAFGEQDTTWNDVLVTRARVVYNSGAQRESNNEVINTYTVTFTVRHYHILDDQMRIKWNNRLYRIESLNQDLSHQQTVIIATVINE